MRALARGLEREAQCGGRRTAHDARQGAELKERGAAVVARGWGCGEAFSTCLASSALTWIKARVRTSRKPWRATAFGKLKEPPNGQVVAHIGEPLRGVG